MSDRKRDEFKRKTLADLSWAIYPRRTARKNVAGRCEFCLKPIWAGDKYADGGENRQAHVSCIKDKS